MTTRLITALAMEAIALVESGVASAEDVDVACRLGFGHAMGPLETADMTGVDIILNATSNIYADTQDEKFSPPEVLRRMVAAGISGARAARVSTSTREVLGPLTRAESTARISLVVYSSLTLLATAAAANAKGYLDSLGELTFVLLVAAAGLVVAHFWAAVLAKRLQDMQAPSGGWLRGSDPQFVDVLPGLLLVGAAWAASLLVDDFEAAVTLGMCTLVVALFAYTWVGGGSENRGRPALGAGYRGGRWPRGRVQGAHLMRLVVAQCQVDYVGRLSAHLPMARRLLLVKADGSVSVHADDRAYKTPELDEPAMRAAGDPRRGEHSLGGHEQGRRAPDHPAGGDRARLVGAVRTGSRLVRTVWRHICRSCWPSRSTRSARTGRWCAASSRPRSVRSICCAATIRARRSRWRSSDAVRSTASNN